MGEARNKKRRFLELHPWCCFCGGIVPSTTIDHIPARTCFVGRHGPEGYEFPACAECQSASRLDEMAFAFYVRVLTSDPANLVPDELERMIEGMANNLPHLLPTLINDKHRKRDTYRRMGIPKPANILAKDLPVIGINSELHSRIERYAGKIALALFYREKGRAAGADYRMHAAWGQATDQKLARTIEAFLRMPNLQVGRRPNLDFGERFVYRFLQTSSPDSFAFVAQFGDGIRINGMIAEPSFAERLTGEAKAAGVTVGRHWDITGENYKSDSYG